MDGAIDCKLPELNANLRAFNTDDTFPYVFIYLFVYLFVYLFIYLLIYSFFAKIAEGAR